MTKTKQESPSLIDLHIGSRLRMRRRMLRLSQTTLASTLEVSFQQLQKYERGANRVSAGALWRLAQELNVPITYFFEGLSRSEVEANAPDLAVVRLIQSPDGVDFARALAKVTDPKTRRAILSLLQELANRTAA